MQTIAVLAAAAATLFVLVRLAGLVFDRWLFGGRRLNHAPQLDPRSGKWTFRNWGGNQTFTPALVEGPRTLEELIALVELHGRAGRKMKAVGGLHSWSACAVAEDVCIPMGGLGRVLAHDASKRTITAEAGIQLRSLYQEMDLRDLAIASIPNVDTIQLGGAVSNATHGTNFTHGTLSSFVVQVQLVVYRAQGKAELLTLRRGDGALFEAAIASFGSLGVIYSVTLQCEEPFCCFVVEHSFPFAHIDGRIEEIARKHYSAFINVASNGDCRSRIQAKLPRDLVEANTACLLTTGDLRMLKVILWAASPGATTHLWLRKALNRAFYGASRGALGALVAKQRRRREGVMSWRDAELLSRVFAVTATAPWINLEYAVPVERADEAARGLLALQKTYPALTSFVMRPVGADSAGFLSPAKDRPTVFFDIPYHQTLIETGVYADMEKLLLSCGGRCSWSRLFKAPAEEVVKQYPQYPEFLRVKYQLDPFNLFSNAFSDSILSMGDRSAPAAREAAAATG